MYKAQNVDATIDMCLQLAKDRRRDLWIYGAFAKAYKCHTPLRQGQLCPQVPVAHRQMAPSNSGQVP